MIHDEPAQTNMPKDEQAQVLSPTDLGMNMVTWQRLCVSMRQYNVIAGTDIFIIKKRSILMIDAVIQFILKLHS